MAAQRSPRYPSIPLDEAVSLATTLWQKEKKTAVSAELVAKAWGYKSASGIVRSKIGALRQYGLLDGTKDGVRISDLAVMLIVHPKDSAEYAKALTDAALNPPLFSEIYKTHSDASNDALRAYLITKKGFSEAAADQFVSSFRAAIALVTGSEPAYDGGGEGDDELPDLDVGQYIQWEGQGTLRFPEPRQITGFSRDGQFVFVKGSDTGVPIREAIKAEAPKSRLESGQRSGRTMPQVEHGGSARVLTIPLPGERVAILETPPGLSAGDHEFLLKYLKIMKGALVGSAQSVDEGDDEGITE